jgi:hypothetical protein
MLDQDDFGVYSRRVGESQKAFVAYCVYRDLGAERSLTGVTQKLHKSATFLGRWSRKWGWVERAVAFDADLAEQERKAKEYALKVEARKWAKRKLEVLEQDWQEAESLGKRIEQMMVFPLQTVEHKTTEESKDGKTFVTNITYIKPVGWSYRDVINGRALVWRMRRLCVGLTTANTTSTVQGTGEGGAIVVEDIEAVRDRRWQAAMPALMRLMRKELGMVGDVLHGGSGEREGNA